MGVVWAAHDPDLERAVAVKVLRGDAAGQELRTRLLREARAMARLKHPNVLTVYEVGSAGDRDYIVMELVDGGSLDAWLKERPPEREVIAAILAAGRGLAAAHDAGLVHRDFKPHNVLRSRDGRVLVTDFGLARGTDLHAAPPAAPAPAPATTATANVALEETAQVTPRRDQVLDSTLTRTGALIGTPAYMAPEQFLGAAPDPRTDQFAFCITAWQALTGERPFRGETLDELRRASAAGVAHVPARLARALRAVLVRGLDPDPEARWPTLDALLDAMLRASGPRRLTAWRISFAVAVAAGVVALGVKLFSGDRAIAPSAPATSPLECTAAEHAFADAWTAPRRALLEQRFGGAVVQVAADALDAVRADWLRAYSAVCAAPRNTAQAARLTCLLGERDEVATAARLLETIPEPIFRRLDLWGQLPRVAACETESPVAPPLMPEDPKLRDRIVAVRVRAMAQLLGSPLEFASHLDELRAAARSIGWKPLDAELESQAGVAAQLTARWGDARSAFEHTIELANDQHDYRLEATAHISLLEIESTNSAAPSEPGRADRLIAQARAAVHRAGDDPSLGLAIDALAANIDLARGDYNSAISADEHNRKQLLDLRAFRRAALAASCEIDGLIRLGRRSDLDTAWQVGNDTLRVIAAAVQGAVQSSPGLEIRLVDVALRRADVDEAHARGDRLQRRAQPTDVVTVTGHVVDAGHKPAAGARVVGWRGALPGDGSRLYTRADVTSDVATTDATGAFTLRVPAGGAVAAELGAARSPPVAIGDDAGKPLALVLAPTRTVTGTVRAAPDAIGGLDVSVHVTAANNEWIDRVPLGQDGTFELRGVPVSASRVVVERDDHQIAAPIASRIELAWPSRAPIDAVVRGAHPDELVVVVRGKHDVHTRAQLTALADSAADVAEAQPRAIGLASRTDLVAYQPGDVHALILDNLPGDATVCTSASDAPRAPVVCSIVVVAPGRGAGVVVVSK
jgi:hypothetical protein